MSKKKENKEDKFSFSRRSFMKGGALVFGGTLLTNITTGCNSNDGTSQIAGTGGSAATYDVVDAGDIIFIGGGIGSFAGFYEAAVEQKKSVTIIDKGPWRAGGATGYNWDMVTVAAGRNNWNTANNPRGITNNAYSTSNANPDATNYFDAPYNNKKLGYEAVRDEKKGSAPIFYYGVGGECLPRRYTAEAAAAGTIPAINRTKEAGNLFFDPDIPLAMDQFPNDPNTMKEYGVATMDGFFPRHTQDYYTKFAEASNGRVKIFDRTMVTNVIVNNGRCVGVMGFHLATGKYTVYKAKAVLLAAGGCVWWAGWETVSPLGANSPDNTADVEMALFRRGCGIGDSEFGQYDYTCDEVRGFVGGYNLALGSDCTHMSMIVDKDNTHYWKNYPSIPDTSKVIFPFTPKDYYVPISAVRLIAASAEYIWSQKNIDPKWSNHHGVYIATSDAQKIAPMRKIYKRNFWLYEKAGINHKARNLRAGVEMFEHGGNPVVDSNLMTEIKGLFNHRGSGVTGDEGGMSSEYVSRRFSQHAARKAIEYINNSSSITSIDFTDANNEIERIETIRTKAGTLRPHVVRQRIQKACQPVCGIIREEHLLKIAETELARIRKEDIPNQYCVDKSKLYNIEWKQAIENFNLLDMAELFVKSSLTRKESRVFLRPEYPTLDNANFRCALVGRMNGGAIKMFKRYLPQADWSAVPNDLASTVAPTFTGEIREEPV